MGDACRHDLVIKVKQSVTKNSIMSVISKNYYCVVYSPDVLSYITIAGGSAAEQGRKSSGHFRSHQNSLLGQNSHITLPHLKTQVKFTGLELKRVGQGQEQGGVKNSQNNACPTGSLEKHRGGRALMTCETVPGLCWPNVPGPLPIFFRISY